MSDRFIAVRSFQFANGSQVTVPVRVCESQEDAKRVVTEDAGNLRAVMSAQLVVPGDRPGEVKPVGMSVAEFLQQVGLTGIAGGCHVVKSDSPLVTAPSPKIVIAH